MDSNEDSTGSPNNLSLSKLPLKRYPFWVSVTFRVERFEGPLDLLLQLVEKEELDISTVSLAAVAEQFVQYVNEAAQIPLEEMADFLVVAAKLMYLKSKFLLPTLQDAELEEGPDLETQLRRYRAFVEAAQRIGVLWNAGQRSYARERPTVQRRDVQFLPPVDVTPDVLSQALHRVIHRLEPLRSLPQAAVGRVVTIQEKIRGLLERIRSAARTTFHEFVGGRQDRSEMVVSFLALLELVKQRFVRVAQTDLFHDIDIEAHPEAPSLDPLSESFV